MSFDFKRIACVLGVLALAGCDTDDFVIAGESDSCSSGEAGELALEECVGEDCDEVVMKPALAERQPEPTHSRPAPALVQERR